MQGRSDICPKQAVSIGHHPDCDVVTTEMLKPLVISRFAADSDGITRIPYTLFGQRRFHLGSLSEVGAKLRFSSLPMPSDRADFMSKVITDALAVWTKMSDNKVIFYPHDPLLEARGLRFNLARMDELLNYGAGALTVLSTDNSGYMRFSDVYYPAPDGPEFWNWLARNDPYAKKVIQHEIGHALGISNDWPQNHPATLALKNLPDGVFCSVMPYDQYILSGVSYCHADCDPAYAVNPGPTDEAMFKLAYQSNAFPQCLGIGSENALNLWISFLQNNINNMVISLCTATINGFVVSFGKNLAFTTANVPSIPEKAVHIVADVGMLGAMIYTEIPVYECTVFGVTAATKYLPECALNRLPESARNILTSRYSIYVVNLVESVRKGHCVIPLVVTSACSLVTTWAGFGLGDSIGEMAANGVSYVVRKARAVITRPAAAPQAVEVDIEAQNLLDQEHVEQPAAQPAAAPQPGYFARLFAFCHRGVAANPEPAAQPDPFEIV